MRTLIPTLLAAALSACAVGPNYRAPVPAPAVLPSASAAGITRETPATLWWTRFDDPVLAGLIAEALVANPDLRVGIARVAAPYMRRERAAGALRVLPVVEVVAAAADQRAAVAAPAHHLGADGFAQRCGLRAAGGRRQRGDGTVEDAVDATELLAVAAQHDEAAVVEQRASRRRAAL